LLNSWLLTLNFQFNLIFHQNKEQLIKTIGTKNLPNVKKLHYLKNCCGPYKTILRIKVKVLYIMCPKHSIAKENFNKTEKTKKKPPQHDSFYIKGSLPKTTSPPFQTSLHKNFKNLFLLSGEFSVRQAQSKVVKSCFGFGSF
jgi:hypothetical protein